jgi:integrase
LSFTQGLISLALSLELASSGCAILFTINKLEMAEGVGFEPTVGLPLLLISSQVPLTTQPPFQPFIYSGFVTNRCLQMDIWILVLYTGCMEEQQAERKAANLEKEWQKTPYANLIRYVSSGTYYARLRVRGKLIRRSLKTTSLTVAKLRLADLEKIERQRIETQGAVLNGTMTFGDALTIFRQRLTENGSLKIRSKTYREERIAALLKSWTSLNATDVRRITKNDCLAWAAKFSSDSSPSNFNNTVGTLRMVLDIALEAGARYDNPARFIKKVRVRLKELHLPDQTKFFKMVKSIELVNKRFSRHCADLVRFLAFGGFRKSESANITWADCDFKKKEIIVRGDPVTGTKNWSIRRVPMIPDMIKLLKKLRDERTDEPETHRVMVVRECQQAINRAAKAVGMARITHHDLRHLFATLCIESGVDIPTVSRWLGHKDGGALAMKVYGHLRDQHSVAMAQKVTFSHA